MPFSLAVVCAFNSTRSPATIDTPSIVAPGAEIWRSTITTMAKSERGLEETEQGVAITPRWPVSAGHAQLEIP